MLAFFIFWQLLLPNDVRHPVYEKLGWLRTKCVTTYNTNYIMCVPRHHQLSFSDPGHILFLEDMLSYPISRPKKGYNILSPITKNWILEGKSIPKLAIFSKNGHWNPQNILRQKVIGNNLFWRLWVIRIGYNILWYISFRGLYNILPFF
jgi:hypothetical protein